MNCETRSYPGTGCYTCVDGKIHWVYGGSHVGEGTFAALVRSDLEQRDRYKAVVDEVRKLEVGDIHPIARGLYGLIQMALTKCDRVSNDPVSR
jgi:hypothetical protein